MTDRQFQSPPHSRHVLEITNAFVSPNRKTQSNDGTIFFKVEPELQFQSELTMIRRNENESGRKQRAVRSERRKWLSSFATQSSLSVPALNSVSSREQSYSECLKWRGHLLLLYIVFDCKPLQEQKRQSSLTSSWKQCLTILCRVMLCSKLVHINWMSIAILQATNYYMGQDYSNFNEKTRAPCSLTKKMKSGSIPIK